MGAPRELKRVSKNFDVLTQGFVYDFLRMILW